MNFKIDSINKETIKTSKETFNLEQVILEYKKQGIELEKKFQPEIEQATKEILSYLKENSIESIHEKLKDRAHYPLGLIMSKLGYFAGEEYKICIDAGGKSGHCVLSDPYDFMDKEKTESEEIPFNVKDAISHFVPFEPDRKNVDGVIWTSGGIMNKFDNKSDIPHLGLWISSNQRGSGLAYGLYRFYERIFGVMKTEQAAKLSLLKTYLRLGFIPKEVLNPISGEKIPTIKIEEVLRGYFTTQQEILDFNIYLEREFVGGEEISK